MTHLPHIDDHEPEHAKSPTAHLLEELQLYGHRPFEGEPDPRPLPEDHLVRAAVADTFDAFICAFQDTRLEPDLEDLLWGIVNVHFRAMKNVRSGTVRHLLAAADCIKRERVPGSREASLPPMSSHEPVALSKDELESVAEKFRVDLGITEDGPVDSLMLDVEGIEVIRLRESDCLDRRTVALLGGEAAGEWSAMSVPLDLEEDRWAVLLNDTHVVERQRVTLLEEYWHILLGHKLTKVARIAEAYGRTYDKVEEHDAYYLASATLLPKRAVADAVAQNQSSVEIGQLFGTSSELVDYRIKRLGLWREHVGKRVALNSEG